MTLGELRDAIAILLENSEASEDDRIGIEYNGYRLDATSVTVIVSSDLWETGMVIVTAGDITEEDGEADDG